MLRSPTAAQRFTHRFGIALGVTKIDIEEIDQWIAKLLAIEGAVDEHRPAVPGVIHQRADHLQLEWPFRARNPKPVARADAVENGEILRNQNGTGFGQTTVVLTLRGRDAGRRDGKVRNVHRD